MPLVTFIVILLVLFIILWLVNAYLVPPLNRASPPLGTVLLVLVVILIILYLLGAFVPGFPSLGTVRVN